MQEARAQSARVSEEALTVDLVDGRTIVVLLIWYPRRWHGTPRERNQLELFGDGTYIHWPALDEDRRPENRRAADAAGCFGATGHVNPPTQKLVYTGECSRWRRPGL
jgi:hypothetical protein